MIFFHSLFRNFPGRYAHPRKSLIPRGFPGPDSLRYSGFGGPGMRKARSRRIFLFFPVTKSDASGAESATLWSSFFGFEGATFLCLLGQIKIQQPPSAFRPATMNFSQAVGVLHNWHSWGYCLGKTGWNGAIFSLVVAIIKRPSKIIEQQNHNATSRQPHHKAVNGFTERKNMLFHSASLFFTHFAPGQPMGLDR